MATSAVQALRFDAGRPCLDLAATLGYRTGPEPVERLTGPERLRQWLVAVDFVPPEQVDGVDDLWLEAFLEVREVVHRVVRSVLHGRPLDDADVRVLNLLAVAAPPAPQVVLIRGGLRWVLAAPVTLEAALSLVARDTVDLLTRTDRSLLRECEGPTCGLVYVDSSPGRRRRWCSAGACGNRERVSQFRSRQRAR